MELNPAALKLNRQLLINLIPFLFLLVSIVIFASQSSSFLAASNLYNIIMASSILLVVASAGTFIILMGCIDLSVGGIATVSGIITSLLVPRFGIPALLVGLLIGTFCGFLNGIVFVGWRIPSFLVTLGMMTTLQGLALYITGGYATPIRNDSYNWLANGRILGNFPCLGLWSLIIYLILVYVNLQTRFGRYMYAIGGEEKISHLSGIPVARYKVLAFTFSGFLSGLAGTLLAARLGSGTPEMGLYLMLESITAVVVGGTAITGGVGGVHRTILGVLVMAILSNGMNIIALHPYVQTIIRGSVVILAVWLILDRRKIGLIK